MWLMKTLLTSVCINQRGAGQTNREEIKAGKGWRSFLGYACTIILTYNYIIVLLLDYFGIVVFSFPLFDIIRILILLLSGN